MSQLRLGRNPDGTRQIQELEPAYARRQGHGGASAGFWTGTVTVHEQRAAKRTRLARQPNPRRSGVQGAVG